MSVLRSDVSGILPKMEWVPNERGILGTLRIHAHEGGIGEAVAQHVGLTNGKVIARVVNSHDALLAALHLARSFVESELASRGDADAEYTAETRAAPVLAELDRAIAAAEKAEGQS